MPTFINCDTMNTNWHGIRLKEILPAAGPGEHRWCMLKLKLKRRLRLRLRMQMIMSTIGEGTAIGAIVGSEIQRRLQRK